LIILAPEQPESKSTPAQRKRKTTPKRAALSLPCISRARAKPRDHRSARPLRTSENYSPAKQETRRGGGRRTCPSLLFRTGGRANADADAAADADAPPLQKPKKMGTSLKSVGIPVKLLHEAVGHVVTVELKTGELFRGQLFDAEDNWNCQLRDVQIFARDGSQRHAAHLFIRGGRIRFFVVPDMLKHAPMFKRIGNPRVWQGRGMGAGTEAAAAGGGPGRGGGRGRGGFGRGRGR
jgi:small nuclear ribonucleoprotein D3